MIISRFNQVYQSLIAEQTLIKQGWWSNVVTAAKDKVKKQVVGDKGFYFNQGSDPADCLQYLYAIRISYGKKLGLPNQPFKTLINHIHKNYAKELKNSKSAAEKVSKDIVDLDKAVTTAISDMYDQVSNTVSGVYKNVKEGTVQLINVIIQAFRIAKDKVIEWLESAVNTVKNISEAAKKKVIAAIEKLKEINTKIRDFELKVILSIAKILAVIAMACIGVIVLTAKMIIKGQQELTRLAIKGAKVALKAGEKAVVTAYKAAKSNIAKTCKAAGSALTNLGDKIQKA